MKKYTALIMFATLLVFSNCKRQYGEFYDPPAGLEGEIYQQLAADPSLSIFVSAIDKVPGLKEELSSSGLFTVMAPDNEAFNKFFGQHPTFKSIDNIPSDSLSIIVKFHIMKWMLFQVDFLNPGVTGTSYGDFKYETRAVSKYVENSLSGKQIPLFYTPKLAQVYTPNFFTYSGITSQDYSDVYGSGVALNPATNMGVMGASVKKVDIAAGNGAYFIIDRVMLPPLNIAQELDFNPEYSEYNAILKKLFLTYSYNRAGTIAQGNNGDINNDGIIDSLFARTYSTDANLDVENPVSANKLGKISLTAFVPTKAAFTNYVNTKLLPNFKNHIDSVPRHTLQMLYQSHITNTMDWPSKIDKKLAVNILGDVISVSRNDIASTKMASNGLFYRLKKVIEPKAFVSITGPLFFGQKYWYFAEMMILTGLLPSFTSDDVDYTLFAPTNEAFNKRGIFWFDMPPIATGKPGFYKTSGTTYASMSVSELSSIVGNHIVLNSALPTGMPDGFYPAQNTSYIVAENGKVYGSERDSIAQIIDADKQMSNGYFHGIDKVMINPQRSIYEAINATNATATPPVTPQYLKFKELCSLAGILSKDFVNITSVDANKKFTLFVPSNEVIIAAQVAGKLPKTGAQGSTTLTAAQKTQLANYLKYFFVPEQQIFTDGKVLGTFATSRLDPSSTPGNDIFQKLIIELPVLTLTSTNGNKAKVDIAQPLVYPQNFQCKDGVIHIIDNAFTYQY